MGDERADCERWDVERLGVLREGEEGGGGRMRCYLEPLISHSNKSYLYLCLRLRCRRCVEMYKRQLCPERAIVRARKRSIHQMDGIYL